MADLVVHEMGESITEAIIGKWLKSVGDYVEADEPVVDLETDKINVELAAPAAGVLAEQRYNEGDTVKVGDIVGMIEEGERPAGQEKEEAKGESESETAPETKTKSESETESETKSETETESTSKPKDKGAEVNDVPERDGSGRVLSPAQRRAHREGKVETRSQSSARATPVTATEREKVVPMSPLRKRIAERLVEAQQSTASLTTFNEVDLGEVIALRNKFKEEFIETHGVKLGFMSFFVKAACEALKLFPGINAEVDGDSIVYKQYYDIGIAVGTDRGLVVPVLRGADKLGFAEIESGIIELATKAKNRKLVLDDLMGATFTVTNGGIYGSMMSTPLLNFPQTGILGMHNIVERPMVVDGEVAVRPMMYTALTYDHRVVDGKEAVQFLVALKQRLEAPDRLLLGV